MPQQIHPRKSGAGKTAKNSRKWSAAVTRNSNALDLKEGVFTSEDPEKIARSLERSAEKSSRKKAGSYRSAMSMLSFYINRAGKNLPGKKKKVLTAAKNKLKEMNDKRRDS
jgi:hypothetical protein